MIANDLRPGMDVHGATVATVARRGTTATVTFESGEAVELDRWAEVPDHNGGLVDAGHAEDEDTDLYGWRAATGAGLEGMGSDEGEDSEEE